MSSCCHDDATGSRQESPERREYERERELMGEREDYRGLVSHWSLWLKMKGVRMLRPFQSWWTKLNFQTDYC